MYLFLEAFPDFPNLLTFISAFVHSSTNSLLFVRPNAGSQESQGNTIQSLEDLQSSGGDACQQMALLLL